MLTIKKDRLIIETCLLAGKIMIENGSEMNRVIDTIDRIAKNAKADDARAYVTLTGIIMSTSGREASQVITIEQRSFDLEKVSVVNKYSREFENGKIGLYRFYYLLTQMDNIVHKYPFWVQLIGAAVVSGTMEVVFQNNVENALITSLIGMIGWIAYYLVDRFTSIQFISEFIAALMMGIISIIMVHLQIANNLDDTIIGGVMPLVPGVPIINAVRDTLAGNLVSGPARGIEAIIVACALGGGVALALKVF